MDAGLLALRWGKRVLLLGAAGVIACILGIALSAAFARPAGAATLPVAGATTLPLPDPLPAPGPLVNQVSGVVQSTTSNPEGTVPAAVAATEGIVAPVTPAPVTSPLPVVGLPIPDLPVIVPVTGALTSTSTSAPTPSGGSSVGPAPGTGAPQHRALDRFSGPSARQTTSTGGGRGASSTSQAKGSPGRTPAPRTPSPSFPLAPSGAGTSLVPGHGTNLWNDVPALILILGALALGGVLLRRRIAPRLLFGSRFAPPG